MITSISHNKSIKIPLSTSIISDCLDKQGNSCYKLDVLVHTHVFVACRNDAFKSFLQSIVLQHIHNKYQMELSFISYPSSTHKGTLQEHTIQDRVLLEELPLTVDIQPDYYCYFPISTDFELCSNQLNGKLITNHITYKIPFPPSSATHYAKRDMLFVYR